MSRFIHKSHNVSVLLYHVVCVAKYRRVVFDEAVEAVLREVCLDIALRYEIEFLEVGTGRPMGRTTTFMFWSDGYFIASVGIQESEEAVRLYVKQQGHDRQYKQLHTQSSAAGDQQNQKNYTD